MRRALRPRLPELSHHFGIQPWDVDRLTFGELKVYLDALKALQQTQSGGR